MSSKEEDLSLNKFYNWHLKDEVKKAHSQRMRHNFGFETPKQSQGKLDSASNRSKSDFSSIRSFSRDGELNLDKLSSKSIRKPKSKMKSSNGLEIDHRAQLNGKSYLKKKPQNFNQSEAKLRKYPGITFLKPGYQYGDQPNHQSPHNSSGSKGQITNSKEKINEFKDMTEEEKDRFIEMRKMNKLRRSRRRKRARELEKKYRFQLQRAFNINNAPIISKEKLKRKITEKSFSSGILSTFPQEFSDWVERKLDQGTPNSNKNPKFNKRKSHPLNNQSKKNKNKAIILGHKNHKHLIGNSDESLDLVLSSNEKSSQNRPRESNNFESVRGSSSGTPQNDSCSVISLPAKRLQDVNQFLGASPQKVSPHFNIKKVSMNQKRSPYETKRDGFQSFQKINELSLNSDFAKSNQREPQNAGLYSAALGVLNKSKKVNLEAGARLTNIVVNTKGIIKNFTSIMAMKQSEESDEQVISC